MTAYLFSEIDVKDQAAWTKDALPTIEDQLRETRGKRIAGGFGKAKAVAGATPHSRVAIVEFPDMAALEEFVEKSRKAREEMGAQNPLRILAIEGV